VKTRVLIVDDEAIARRKLRRILVENLGAEIAAECGNGDDAVAAILRHRPNLVFLDIQMPGGGGFSVVNRVHPGAMPPTVFVTAYDQHAVQAFQVHAVDYLLKPITAERVAEAYSRCLDRLAQQQNRNDLKALLEAIAEISAAHKQDVASAQTESWLQWLVASGTRDSLLIPVDQIDWIESAGNYVRLHLAGGESFLYRNSLNYLAARLPPRLFIRVHRFAIVRISRIRKIGTWFGGDQLLHLEDGTQVKLSRNYRKAFNALIHNALDVSE
jgi:two-component system LytT family response regulator